jgi:hypothetical protein
MDRVHVSVDWPVCSVHRGPTLVRTEGTTARSPELGLRPLRCTNAHRRGRKMERGARGTRLGSHRSSGDDEEAGRQQCRRGRRRRSVRGRLECGEKRGEAGRGAVSSGVVLAFYRGRGERRGGVAGVVNTSVNGFNAIEDGRLDERLRREIKRGEMKARW